MIIECFNLNRLTNKYKQGMEKNTIIKISTQNI